MKKEARVNIFKINDFSPFDLGYNMFPENKI